MKHPALIILLSCILFASCSTSRPGNIKDEQQISLITLSRTPCFGTCPIYTLQIDKNCVATLDAVNHLPNGLKGWYTSNIPEKEWMNLVKALDKMKYQSLEDEYGNRQITDLPSVNTAVTFADGNLKKVNDYGGRGTKELSDWYAAVDALIAKLEWEPTDAK